MDRINPKIVIPMHYGTDRHKFKLDGIDKFLSLFDKRQIQVIQNDSLTLQDVPQNLHPQIYVLQTFTD